MEGGSSHKRKIDHDPSSKPATKNQKLTVKGGKHPFDYSKLPPEMLLTIFDYLKPEDKCIKELSLVCKEFYKICSPRLRVLRLDFDKITASGRFPITKRAYTEIRICGKENYCRRDEMIERVLESSKYSAHKLSISGQPWPIEEKRMQIKLRTLMFILKSLPNLEEVIIVEIDALPELFDEAMARNEFTKLRKLTIMLATASILSAFTNAENIEELKLMELISNADKGRYYNIVSRQKNLRILELHLSENAMLVNRLFTVAGRLFANLLEDHPKLEHIKVEPAYYGQIIMGLAFISIESLISGPPITSVKTIDLTSTVILDREELVIGSIREKFPSLECFKSLNFRWSINNA